MKALQHSSTDWCTKLMWCATFSLSSEIEVSASPSKRIATEMSASLGHGWNQSMTVAEMRAGNLRHWYVCSCARSRPPRSR